MGKTKGNWAVSLWIWKAKSGPQCRVINLACRASQLGRPVVHLPLYMSDLGNEYSLNSFSSTSRIGAWTDSIQQQHLLLCDYQ